MLNEPNDAYKYISFNLLYPQTASVSLYRKNRTGSSEIIRNDDGIDMNTSSHLKMIHLKFVT